MKSPGRSSIARPSSPFPFMTRRRVSAIRAKRVCFLYLFYLLQIQKSISSTFTRRGSSEPTYLMSGKIRTWRTLYNLRSNSSWRKSKERATIPSGLRGAWNTCFCACIYRSHYRNSWRLTLLRKAKRHRVEVKYIGQPACLSGKPLEPHQPPFLAVLEELRPSLASPV